MRWDGIAWSMPMAGCVESEYCEHRGWQARARVVYTLGRKKELGSDVARGRGLLHLSLPLTPLLSHLSPLFHYFNATPGRCDCGDWDERLSSAASHDALKTSTLSANRAAPKCPHDIASKYETHVFELRNQCGL